MRPPTEIKIAAFTKYDREAASTRQRVLQYLPHLARAGIDVEVHALLDDAYVRSLASGAAASKTAIAAAYARRLRQLLRPQAADLIWVYAELFPWLPAGFERLAFRSGKPIVYDFDDAFFHPYDNHRNPLVRRALEDKLVPLIKGAAAVCAGNAYLKGYATRAGANAIVLPTVVDIDQYVPAKTRPDRRLTIGWIGSPSTWGFVRPLLPLLAELCHTHGVAFSAVGAGAAAETDRFAGLTFSPWTEASEIASVQAMDIGIMPLPDEPWARGKCGYKLIQYMACGLPVVASPVGVNSDIVEVGVSGFLATDTEQWRTALTRLIDNPALRAAMGEAGRARAVKAYSLQTHAPRLVEIMRGAVGATGRTTP
ncbi:MAG: glycosyltransferase family 4 protein [Sphingomicrobium sp.]